MKSIMNCVAVFTLSGLVPGSSQVPALSPPLELESDTAFMISTEETHEVDILGQVVDGLGRPVAMACVKVVPRISSPKTPIAEALTDKDGRYSFKVAKLRSQVAIILEKDGYHATFEDDQREVYCLRKNFDWGLARRLPNLHGKDLDQGLMELRTQWVPLDTFDTDKYYFRHQTVFRPALRRLLKVDPSPDDLTDRLDLWGDPADQDLFPGKRRSDKNPLPIRRSYAPLWDVREEDLADAIKVAMNQTNGEEYYKKHPEERTAIEFIVFNVEMDRAMVASGSDLDPPDEISALFVFHKEGKKWILRSSKYMRRM